MLPPVPSGTALVLTASVQQPAGIVTAPAPAPAPAPLPTEPAAADKPESGEAADTPKDTAA
jgi:hypothetical protein